MKSSKIISYEDCLKYAAKYDSSVNYIDIYFSLLEHLSSKEKEGKIEVSN